MKQMLRNVMILLGLSISILNIYFLTRPPTELLELYPQHPSGAAALSNNNNNDYDHSESSSSIPVTRNAVASNSNSNNNNNNGGVYIGADFFQSHKVTEESKLTLTTTQQQQLKMLQQQQQQQNSQQQQQQQQQNDHSFWNRKSKMIIGIISSDTFNDYAYRKRHRELFALWNDPRVCSVAELRESTSNNKKCQIYYTFVLGAADPNEGELAPTELLYNTTERYIERTKPITMQYAYDCNDPDMTLLNIRENMNDGKSQTFFYWASLMMGGTTSNNNDNLNAARSDNYIDYVMKLDADAILHLHDFLLFLDTQLPPFPYNRQILAGALRNKAHWPKHADADLPRFDSHWGNQYEGVHLYVAGQAYIVSNDLCHWIATEAPFSKIRIDDGGYIEQHEDHDISAMIFHSSDAVHLLAVGKSQRFWEHPVKGLRRWERIIKRETARMEQTEFEGRILRLY